MPGGELIPRPEHHFTPPHNWMNDPNGLIRTGKYYHLFYQHNPLKNEFGNISWGHARTTDLKNWEHLPLALSFSRGVMIYSGTVVEDFNNSSGLGSGTLLSFYTEHVYESEEVYEESIKYAVSYDAGISWSKPEQNSVLIHKEKDFRDPRIFWYEDQKKWVMAVSLPKKYTIEFYESSDLIQWAKSGSFTSDDHGNKYWECPDLFPIQDENGEVFWILSISGDNEDGHSWGMFYYVGDFDGNNFDSGSDRKFLDKGTDFYAGITWEGTGNERVMMAWCNNWAYADKTGNPDWTGIMSSPRKLVLRDGQLIQQFVTDITPVILEPGSILDRQSYKIMVDERSVSFDRSFSSKFKELEDFNLRTLQFEKIGEVRVYEDHGIVELLVNNEISASFIY